MDDLIEALTIFRKYSDANYPTWCEHDTLHVVVDPNDVSKEDIERLDELGFNTGTNVNGDPEFYSFRFGSC